MKKVSNGKFPTRLNLQPYKGSDISGVNAFQIGTDYIVVAYKDGRIYLYNYEFPGEERVEIMKQKARGGKGLGSYINSEIRYFYVGQWDYSSKIFRRNKNIAA